MNEKMATEQPMGPADSASVYQRFGVTIVYNTQSLSDKNATIYDIIVDE